MKYEVNYKCSHTTQVDITGTNVRGERDRKHEYLVGQYATRLCPDCQAKADAPAEAQQITVKYSEYKNDPKYSGCQTVPNSYDKKNKTIDIYYSAARMPLRYLSL